MIQTKTIQGCTEEGKMGKFVTTTTDTGHVLKENQQNLKQHLMKMDIKEVLEEQRSWNL